MAEIQFQEDHYDKRVLARRKHGNWLIEFVLSTGVVKSERGAQVLLILFTVVSAGASLYIDMGLFTPAPGGYTSSELSERVAQMQAAHH